MGAAVWGEFKFLAVAGPPDPIRPQELKGEGFYLFKVLDALAGEMNEENSSNLTVLEEAKQLLSRDMGQFTDQQIQGLLHQGREIFYSANISAVSNPEIVGFDEKAESFVTLGVFRLKAFAKTPEVSCRVGSDPDRSG
jgi:hypothetical protein